MDYGGSFMQQPRGVRPLPDNAYGPQPFLDGGAMQGDLEKIRI